MKKQLIEIATERGFISRDNLTSVNDSYYHLWLREVQKWLMQTRNVHITINPYINFLDEVLWEVLIINVKPNKVLFQRIGIEDDDEALEFGLLNAL